MKTILDGVLVFLSAISLIAPANAIEPDKLFELVSPSIFLVVTFDNNHKKLGSGSGVVIGPEQVITNCHVLAKSSKVLLVRNQETYEATLEYPDPERDLCQLKIPNLKAPSVRIGKAGTLKVGQRVYAVGAPKGLQLSLSDGLVSSLRDSKQGAPQIQTTAPISPGSSGGGLFDSNGLLVGITTWLVRDAQNLNFAYPAEWIEQVPDRGRNNLAKLEESLKARNEKNTSLGAGLSLPPFDYNLPPSLPQVGDSWTYTHVDLRYKPGDRSHRYVHTIVDSKPSLISESISTPGGGRILESSYTPTMVGFIRMGIIEISPFLLSFEEIQIGKTWRNIKIASNSMDLVAPIALSQGQALGHETVTVPAGQFEAIKVRFEGDIVRALFGHTSVPQNREIINVTVWYSKSTKRAVKLLLEGLTTADSYELESFRIR